MSGFFKCGLLAASVFAANPAFAAIYHSHSLLQPQACKAVEWTLKERLPALSRRDTTTRETSSRRAVIPFG
jgi:hypothetical protein